MSSDCPPCIDCGRPTFWRGMSPAVGEYHCRACEKEAERVALDRKKERTDSRKGKKKLSTAQLLQASRQRFAK